MSSRVQTNQSWENDIWILESMVKQLKFEVTNVENNVSFPTSRRVTIIFQQIDTLRAELKI